MASAGNMTQENLSREMKKAAKSGDLQKVKGITAKYGLSHCKEWLDGCALLYAALRHNQLDVVQFLIEAGAKLTNSEKKISIFHEAVAKSLRFLPIVELLLTKGASVNARNHEGNSPLHCVKTLGMAKLLFSPLADTRPDVNAANTAGLTPLHVAVVCGNVHVTQFLLANGADANSNGSEECELYTPLHLATKFNRSDIVGLLLQNKGLVNSKCKEGTPLHIACESGLTDMVRFLINYEADIEATDEEGKTPIYRAIEHVDSHALIVQSLIKKGAVLKPSPGLLYDALRHRCPKLIDILIKQGCDVNERVDGQTALHYAVCFLLRGDGADGQKIVHLLLANGADVNAQTKATGSTALSLVIKSKFFEVIPILLEYGAEYQIPPTGDTVLHLCAQAGRVTAHTYKALLKRGGDINARNSSGDTPLHLAVANRHSICPIRALLSWPDVDIDARDQDGNTALAKAAAGCALAPLSTLLSYGADVNIRNKKGLTPLQVVEEYRATGSQRTYPVLCVSMALRSHVAKLKCADLPLSEDNLFACKPTRYVGEQVFSDPNRYTRETLDDPDFVKRCKDVVEKMKNQRFANSCISYYDILSRSRRQLAIFTKNASVSRVMDSIESGTKKFPVYGRWIDVRYRRAKRRVQLQERAVASLNAIFDFLPHICTDLIADFLSNEDLKKCSDGYPGFED